MGKVAVGLQSLKAKLVQSVEWSMVDGILYFQGKIYILNTSDLRRQIVALCHDSRIAGHSGRWKTFELVSQNYWWSNMSKYIGKYISTCDMCLRTKSFHCPSTGELHPVPVPDAPWDTISVNFIIELPESAGYDSIMVTVNSITKRAHFIPTTLSAAGTAQLSLQHIWKHHSLPQKVVSDHGPQFVAEFMRELYWLLRVKLAATTTYHPQGDGQTERVNQELEQYIRLFTNQRQDNWVGLLPLSEFQYNNQVHSSTQHSPFLLDTGQTPHMGFELDQPQSQVESVNEFKERVRDTLEEAKSALVKSKDDMAQYYNRKQTLAPEYRSGDLVYLNSRDIQTTRPSQKLSHRRLGPFPIKKRVSNSAYQLRLPLSMSWLHPVFNVVKLSLAPPDPAPPDLVPGRRAQPPPPLEIIDGEKE